MTKAEERAVLEQISDLISSTGEDSYIALAFAGCVQLAKENIDNDWGCSPADWKRNAESAAEQLKDAKEEIACEEERIAYLKTKVPSNAIIADMFNLLLEGQEYYHKQQSLMANTIVEYAEDPESEAFKIAVRKNRIFADKANKCDMLTDYLKSI